MATKTELEQIKQRLLEEQDRLHAEHAESVLLGEEQGSELADYDPNHPGDAGTDTFERTKDFAIDENNREILRQIEDALRKIEDGTYGTCDRCGREINPDRLKAIPYASLCIECQEALERR